MTNRLFIGICCLLMAFTTARSASLTAYRIPAQRFQGWTQVQNDSDDTVLYQIWRQPLTDMPKGAEGYMMVAYQVIHTESFLQAEAYVAKLLQKEQYNEYVAQGLSVSSTPWTAGGDQGVKFTVQGLSHSTANARAQRAEIYTLAFTHDADVVLLQVRQVITAKDLGVMDKTPKKTITPTIADDTAALVHALWADGATVQPVPQPAEEPVEEPMTTEPAVGTTPPVNEETPAPVDGLHWKTADGLFSLTLPTGWTATGKTPVIFTDKEDVNIRLYPSEPYTTDAARDKALASFVAGQRDVAASHFSSAAVQIDGATGMSVRYTNYAKRTTAAYLLAKSGRLWRVEVDLPGTNTALPGGVVGIINSINMQ